MFGFCSVLICSSSVIFCGLILSPLKTSETTRDHLLKRGLSRAVLPLLIRRCSVFEAKNCQTATTSVNVVGFTTRKNRGRPLVKLPSRFFYFFDVIICFFGANTLAPDKKKHRPPLERKHIITHFACGKLGGFVRFDLC